MIPADETLADSVLSDNEQVASSGGCGGSST